jgi:hypothetical protein
MRADIPPMLPGGGDCLGLPRVADRDRPGDAALVEDQLAIASPAGLCERGDGLVARL